MLDPRRLGLNAESVGFQKRMRQDVDFQAFELALQTDYNNQGSAIQVRREKETPVNEIHIMGGERAGFQSNDLIKTIARQERQINGYPLRQFSALNPAVMLPKKYGGFPLYNRNQTEYPELVSVFTEPMSAPLQRGTELLGRMGTVALSNSLSTPYEADGFLNPMTNTYDSLRQNQNEFKQRRHLQKMSQMARYQKFTLPDGPTGIFISKDGQPMSGVSEQIADALPQYSTFADAALLRAAKMAKIQNLEGGVAGEVQMDGAGNSGLGMLREGPTTAENRILGTNSRFVFQAADEGTVAMIANERYDRTPNQRDQLSIMAPESLYYPQSGGRHYGMQTGNLVTPIEQSMYVASPDSGIVDIHAQRTKRRLSFEGEPKNRDQEEMGLFVREARNRRQALRKTTPGRKFTTPKKIFSPGIATLQSMSAERKKRTPSPGIKTIRSLRTM